MCSGTPYLFVYGTLRTDVINTRAELWQNFASLQATGKIRGRLYDVGSYPAATGFVLRHERVCGQLLSLHNESKALNILDAYEEYGRPFKPPYEYQRRIIPVDILGQRSVQAWCYFYARDTRYLIRILSGDYARYTRRNVRRLP